MEKSCIAFPALSRLENLAMLKRGSVVDVALLTHPLLGKQKNNANFLLKCIFISTETSYDFDSATKYSNTHLRDLLRCILDPLMKPLNTVDHLQRG